MGVDFQCGETSFGCSYGHWNEIRRSIIFASLDYIQDKFSKDNELYKNIKEGDENWIGEGSEYYDYMKYINNLKNILLNDNIKPNVFGLKTDQTINIFIRTCYNLSFLNALNYFELGGLFALCNQTDGEGYYTPGNSLDICSLFDRIEPFVQKYDDYNNIYNKEESIYSNNRLYDVFEYSYKTLKRVTIS